MRTEKSCGPDASTLALSSWEASFLGVTVTRKPIAGEITKEAVKTIRVRGCRVISGATAVNTRVHSATTTWHTRLRVHWAPGIPHALSLGGRFFQHLGRLAPRDRGIVLG